MTSRELVYETLEFCNKTDRVPRDMWVLPLCIKKHGNMVNTIYRDFPLDFEYAPVILSTPTIEVGDLYKKGHYTDPWGCLFTNVQDGIHGQAKDPLVMGEEWEDVDNIHIPVEQLTFDIDQVNAFCRNTDKFVLAGCLPRPFEQLQFIRTTQLLMMDLMDMPDNLKTFLGKMHTFYCDLLEKWAKTDVDGLYWMDDWGSQRSMLVNPLLWDAIFRPMYTDYIDIARRHGKKTFMHSDGNILDLYPRLTEMGLDALNSQLFIMDFNELAKYRGKITFWGEICRQHILPEGSVADVENAVRKVYDNLWSDGGCIALIEFSGETKPENAYAVYNTWKKLRP